MALTQEQIAQLISALNTLPDPNSFTGQEYLMNQQIRNGTYTPPAPPASTPRNYLDYAQPSATSGGASRPETPEQLLASLPQINSGEEFPGRSLAPRRRGRDDTDNVYDLSEGGQYDPGQVLGLNGVGYNGVKVRGTPYAFVKMFAGGQGQPTIEQEIANLKSRGVTVVNDAVYGPLALTDEKYGAVHGKQKEDGFSKFLNAAIPFGVKAALAYGTGQGISSLFGSGGLLGDGFNPYGANEFADVGMESSPGFMQDPYSAAAGAFPQATIGAGGALAQGAGGAGAASGGASIGGAGAAAGAAGSGLLGTLRNNAGLIGVGLTGAGLLGSQFNKPDMPADPNFIGAANAQGEASRKAAEQAAMLSNPNISTPYGSQQVTWTRDAQGNLIPSINQQLAPAQQALLDQQNQLKTNLGNTALKGMENVNQTMSTKFNPADYGVGGVQSQINTSGLPGIQNSLDMSGVPGMPDQGGIQRNVDMSGVARMPVNAGMTGQNAIMQRLQPQIERERQQQETQLRNQGLVAGGEAYNNAMNIQGQRENDLLSQASLYGLNLDFNANQQGYNQALGQGQFANQAQNQGFGQGLAANQQGYNQALGQGNFANSAQNQGFSQAAAQSQFANQAQNQGFSQALTQRQLPINETNALMTGSQVSNPQFQQFQGQNFQAAPLFNATGQQAQYNQGLFGLNQANNNSFMTGLGSLGSAISSAPKGSIFNP